MNDIIDYLRHKLVIIFVFRKIQGRKGENDGSLSARTLMTAFGSKHSDDIQ